MRLASGARLEFDEEKFKDAFAADPDAVTRFFTTVDRGAAAQLKKQLKAITDRDGLLPRRGEALQGQKDLLNKRVEQLSDLLDRKRLRLLRQFQAMEESLSRLQSQGSALGSFSSMLSTASSQRTGV